MSLRICAVSPESSPLAYTKNGRLGPKIRLLALLDTSRLMFKGGCSAYAISTKIVCGDPYTVKPVLSGHSNRTPKIGFQYQLSLNAGQKYCRMLQREHSAILSTFIKLPFSIKTFVLSIFKWSLKTGFTVFMKIV